MVRKTVNRFSRATNAGGVCEVTMLRKHRREHALGGRISRSCLKPPSQSSLVSCGPCVLRISPMAMNVSTARMVSPIIIALIPVAPIPLCPSRIVGTRRRLFRAQMLSKRLEVWARPRPKQWALGLRPDRFWVATASQKVTRRHWTAPAARANHCKINQMTTRHDRTKRFR
jgi:hypothetical protein